jgi:hypothetical protein
MEYNGENRIVPTPEMVFLNFDKNKLAPYTHIHSFIPNVQHRPARLDFYIDSAFFPPPNANGMHFSNLHSPHTQSHIFNVRMQQKDVPVQMNELDTHKKN